MPFSTPIGFDAENTVPLDHMAQDIERWRLLLEQQKEIEDEIRDIRDKLMLEIGEQRGGLVGGALAVRVKGGGYRRSVNWDAVKAVIPAEMQGRIMKLTQTTRYPTLTS